jgi:hypothetical protein
MLYFLIDNIFVLFGGRVQQTIGVPIGTNCAPLLADLFLPVCGIYKEEKSNVLMPCYKHTEI